MFFGPVYSGTASTPTLMRNTVLAGLALVFILRGTWTGDRRLGRRRRTAA